MTYNAHHSHRSNDASAWWDPKSPKNGSLRVLHRCCNVFGWSKEFASRVLLGYRDFLECKALADDCESSKLIPSTLIHQMWQQHILDTKHYEHDCFFLLGTKLHFLPDDNSRNSNINSCNDRNKRIVETRKLLCKHKNCQAIDLDNEVWSYPPPPKIQLDGTNNKKKTHKSETSVQDIDPRPNIKRKISHGVKITISFSCNDGPQKKKETAEFRITNSMKLNRIFETFAKQRAVPRKSLAFLMRSKDENGNYLHDDSGKWIHQTLDGSETPLIFNLTNDHELCIDCEPTRWEC